MKKHTKSKTGRRRSHLALKPKKVSVCKSCSYPTLPHKTCPNCRTYK
ncbi:MAG: 50S ribosomal protein L32 [Patescibacteria group bacterium]|nr:50S ribosomal protein L32 [Patescibacteria group bacterium]